MLLVNSDVRNTEVQPQGINTHIRRRSERSSIVQVCVGRVAA